MALKRFVIEMETSLHTRLKVAAATNGITMTQILNDLLKANLPLYEQKDGNPYGK